MNLKFFMACSQGTDLDAPRWRHRHGQVENNDSFNVDEDSIEL